MFGVRYRARHRTGHPPHSAWLSGNRLSRLCQPFHPETSRNAGSGCDWGLARCQTPCQTPLGGLFRELSGEYGVSVKLISWFRHLLWRLQPPGNRVPLEDDPRMPGTNDGAPPNITSVEQHQ